MFLGCNQVTPRYYELSTQMPAVWMVPQVLLGVAIHLSLWELWVTPSEMLPTCSLPSILGTTVREKLGTCQDPAGPMQAGIPARLCPHFSPRRTLPFQRIINTDGNSVRTRFPILLPTVARAAPQHRCDIQHSQPPRLQHLLHTLLTLSASATSSSRKPSLPPPCPARQG